MFKPNTIQIRVIVAAIAVVALGGAGVGAASARSGGSPAIPLNNGQETTGANTGAHGFFSYSIGDGEICYTMSARKLSVPAAAAHIHVGPRTVAGPVVIPLTVGTGTSWTVSDCVAVADDTLLDAISENPGAYYVNVHTATFPGGEIRGQMK